VKVVRGAAQLEIEEVSGSGVVRDRRGRSGDRPDGEVAGGNGGVAGGRRWLWFPGGPG
jgi:hypothetical protein